MLARYLSPAAQRMLDRYGRRTPRITEWYPRARHAGMRVDAWPGKPGHIWGSDPELMREQLLDEFGIYYAVLEVLSGQDCYDHPDFAAEWNQAVNEWQVEEWLGFDSRLRGTIAVPHEYPDLAVAEIERRAADDRFVAVLLPANAAERWARRNTDRSTRPPPHTAARSSSTRAATSIIAVRAIRRSTSSTTSGTGSSSRASSRAWWPADCSTRSQGFAWF
jgi:predicted TIM-barrel fold metal-dependent hydrolase